MLFLVFKIGDERYALDAARVIEVVPLLAMKHMPHAPAGFAGVFNFRGRPVPALDLCQVTLGRPAREQLSTRIIILSYPGQEGREHLLGLIAEHATEIMRKDPSEFKAGGFRLPGAPYLGPVLMAPGGTIQRIYEQHLLSETVREALFEQLPQTVP